MIQLNSSIKFFMSAFFNSGEKILDIVWPDTIEIKGRVKLEDFQKFVKDLRHSKNRSIMVISLCCKVGSTKDGVGGIQEVAKRFEVNQRVGFAEIENGPYIYICPRNEAVITNLGKYGFWKGVSTVDTNQDSLIGFVVWDRNPLVKTSTTECSIEKVQAIQGSQVEAQDVTDDFPSRYVHAAKIGKAVYHSEAEIPDSPSELASKLLVQSSQVTSFRVPSLIASPTSQDLQMSSHDIPSIPLETLETRQHVRPITDSHAGSVQVEEPNSYFHEVKKFTLASKPYKTGIHGLPLDAMGEATPSDLATEKNHIIGGLSGSITQQKYVSSDDSPELQQCPSLLNLHSSHTPDDEEDLPEFFFSPPYGHDIKPNVHSLNNDIGGTGQFQQPSDSFFQAREKIGAQGTSAYIGSSKITNPISHYGMERDCFRENTGFGDGYRMMWQSSEFCHEKLLKNGPTGLSPPGDEGLFFRRSPHVEAVRGLFPRHPPLIPADQGLFDGHRPPPLSDQGLYPLYPPHVPADQQLYRRHPPLVPAEQGSYPPHPPDLPDQGFYPWHPPPIPADQGFFHWHHPRVPGDHGFIPHCPPSFAPGYYGNNNVTSPGQQHWMFGQRPQTSNASGSSQHMRPPRGFAPWRPMSHPRPGNNHHGFERSDGFSGSRTRHYSGRENGSGSRPSSSSLHW
ncbi:uncharacterized protein [Lolium perenne]